MSAVLSALLLGAGTSSEAAQCRMSTQPWLLNGSNLHGNTLANHLLLATDLSPGGAFFNVTGYGGGNAAAAGSPMRGNPWAGSITGNTVHLKITAGTFGKDQNYADQTCTGTFSSDCTAIDWGPQSCLIHATGKPPAPPRPGVAAPIWCGAWTSGCGAPVPPYGMGLSFWDVFDDNMVLQMEPAAAAVYGVAAPSATGVAVTVTEHTSGVTYTVHADKIGVNATHQPVGPDFAGMHGNVPGPWTAWKVLLKPTKAGGNYTLFAECTGCTATAVYSNATITNVTFGDVWHCSGQSNMWLPLSASFNLNETIGNITSETNPKYRNIRGMFGNSGTGETINASPWMTALQGASLLPVGNRGGLYRKIQDFGATCWYFAQRLTDELAAAGKPIIPIGLTDTAIGGQRIEEYMVNDTATGGIFSCDDVTANDWNGHLYASMTTPFVDMTVKGWLWYQGENNMGNTKGNSLASVGYACRQKALVAGWRRVWSETPGTTDPMAPFGIVTLASSGSEGGPHMGAMRQAQTASYGTLPGPPGSGMENTFFAQAYDLDDEWGPAAGPCWDGWPDGRRMSGGWECCNGGPTPGGHHTKNTTSCTPDLAKKCAPSCAAMAGTTSHGGIHPRSKKQVGDRLGAAGYSVVYGGTAAYTGPTLAGCAVGGGKTLRVAFNTSLLMGDKVTVRPFPPVLRGGGGSQLYVQINASNFCMEPLPVINKTSGRGIPGTEMCPTWAGGDGKSVTHFDEAEQEAVDAAQKPPPPPPPAPVIRLDTQWIMVNYSLGSDGSSLDVDLSPLNGSAPTAVRYGWGIIDCCDYSDPELYITHGCVANCPVMSSSALFPANPFMAKITGGKCECIAPQVC